VEFLGRVAPGPAPFFLYLPFQNVHSPYTVRPARRTAGGPRSASAGLLAALRTRLDRKRTQMPARPTTSPPPPPPPPGGCSAVLIVG
jgi:hypothetical protein